MRVQWVDPRDDQPAGNDCTVKWRPIFGPDRTEARRGPRRFPSYATRHAAVRQVEVSVVVEKAPSRRRQPPASRSAWPGSRPCTPRTAVRAAWVRAPPVTPTAEAQKAKGRIKRFGPSKPRQRPTLPQACAYSTIGPGELNFRVRDGNGCDISGITARKKHSKCEASESQFLRFVTCCKVSVRRNVEEHVWDDANGLDSPISRRASTSTVGPLTAPALTPQGSSQYIGGQASRPISTG
jgi:hypothetical protein